MSGTKDQLVSLAFRKSPRSSEGAPAASPKGGKPGGQGGLQLSASAVKRRAQEIGIREQQLYWIAEKSLQNPLPGAWIDAATDDGYVYYFNEETKRVDLASPALDHYKAQYQTILRQRQEKHEEYERRKAEAEQQSNNNNNKMLPRTESASSVVSNLSMKEELPTPAPVPTTITPCLLRRVFRRGQRTILSHRL